MIKNTVYLLCQVVNPLSHQPATIVLHLGSKYKVHLRTLYFKILHISRLMFISRNTNWYSTIYETYFYAIPNSTHYDYVCFIFIKPLYLIKEVYFFVFKLLLLKISNFYGILFLYNKEWWFYERKLL